MTPTYRITTTAAAVLAVAAATVPVATARPLEDPALAANPAPTTVYSRPDKTEIPATPHGARPAVISGAPQAVVRIQTQQSGFDWGDAGIGAAGGLALAMLGLGGGLVISQRPRRARHSTARPS
jgi:hypothetical protein